jgi:hypothetical protein
MMHSARHKDRARIFRKVGMMASYKAVAPLKSGIQVLCNSLRIMDSPFVILDTDTGPE